MSKYSFLPFFITELTNRKLKCLNIRKDYFANKKNLNKFENACFKNISFTVIKNYLFLMYMCIASDIVRCIRYRKMYIVKEYVTIKTAAGQ